MEPCGICPVCNGYPGRAWCDDRPFVGFEPATEYVQRHEIDGVAQYLTPVVVRGETTCTAPEGHDCYVTLDRSCDHCGAAL